MGVRAGAQQQEVNGEPTAAGTKAQSGPTAQEEPTAASKTAPAVAGDAEPTAAPNAAAGIAGARKTNAEGTSNDRIFGVLPNYMTVENAQNLPPLTTGQKFALASDGTFDKVEFAFVGVLAGLNQEEHENPSRGYSWAGYGKRYAEAFANEGIENFFVGAIYPTLFHQDPRYFQMAEGGYARRAWYAASRIFVTRTDAGGTEFNSSEIAGSFSAAAISNLYEPRESRTVTNTAEIWGTQILIDTFSNELREFWPDLRRGMKHL